MRQRVALARTFAPDASVLLMDEPFGAVDAGLKLQLGEFLLDLWTHMQRTVVFVTHDLYEAIGLADRIVLMRPGAIVRDVKVPLSRPRSIEELQQDAEYHALYRKLWLDMKEINR
jgi:NitT/TauT family transport system ATP-binding protein